jgi:hypothetical protein
MMSRDKAVTKAKAIEKIVKKCKNQDWCNECYFFNGEDRQHQRCYLSKLTGDRPINWRDDNVARQSD